MVDLEMMAAVLAALPAKARLVLLGDKDQLASVEAGAVCRPVVHARRQGPLHARHRHWLARTSGEQVEAELIDPDGEALDQAVVMLRHSYRFSGDSGIGQLAAAVNAGSVEDVRRALDHGYTDLTPWSSWPAKVKFALRRLVIDGAGDMSGWISSLSGNPHNLCPLAGTGQVEIGEWAHRVLYRPWAVSASLRTAARPVGR